MIFFRTDGNEIIGSGHIMRCLSIADAFRLMKQDCCFVVADSSFVDIIEQRGYRTIVLGTDYRKMEDEISLLKKYIEDSYIDIVIVDSYYVTERYLRELKSIVKLIYIDDLASFSYPVDYIVNYNAYSMELDYLGLFKDSATELPNLLLGMKYVPLRDEFRRVNKKIIGQCKEVFISTGGADSLHLTLEIVKYINQHDIKEHNYHFVLGAMNQDIEEIRNVVRHLSNVFLHTNVMNMKELMCSCDIAVSAAGSTLYELCACGVPTITYVLADNQILGAKAFEKQGIMKSLGDMRLCTNRAEKILEAIRQLEADWIKRKIVSRRMQELIDGDGAVRLVADVCSENFFIKV